MKLCEVASSEAVMARQRVMKVCAAVVAVFVGFCGVVSAVVLACMQRIIGAACSGGRLAMFHGLPCGEQPLAQRWSAG
jgi:hypothetical protein